MNNFRHTGIDKNPTFKSGWRGGVSIRMSRRFSVLSATTLFPVLSLVFFSSCKKEEPLMSVIPEIRIIQVEPQTIVQFQDSVSVTMEYLDGDGNLGYEHPDSMALKVKDARLDYPDWYFVKPLAPIGSNVAIRGELTFKLHGTFLLGQGSSESTSYKIQIRDREGNWSNEIETPSITITR